MKCPNCGIQIAHWRSSYNDIQINEMMGNKNTKYKDLLKNIIRKIIEIEETVFSFSGQTDKTEYVYGDTLTISGNVSETLFKNDICCKN